MLLAKQDVCDFCNQHLEANQEAFANPKLKLIYDDAKAQLQQCQGTFDVIVADLADPVYGGPCYQVMLVSCSTMLLLLSRCPCFCLLVVPEPALTTLCTCYSKFSIDELGTPIAVGTTCIKQPINQLLLDFSKHQDKATCHLQQVLSVK